ETALVPKRGTAYGAGYMDGHEDPITAAQWRARHPDAIPKGPGIRERHGALGPDAFTLEVVVAPRSDPSMIARAPDGTRLQMGKPLRAQRALSGGDEGLAPHPITGERLPVSLRPWADADPDATFVQIRFVLNHSIDVDGRSASSRADA